MITNSISNGDKNEGETGRNEIEVEKEGKKSTRQCVSADFQMCDKTSGNVGGVCKSMNVKIYTDHCEAHSAG